MSDEMRPAISPGDLPDIKKGIEDMQHKINNHMTNEDILKDCAWIIAGAVLAGLALVASTEVILIAAIIGTAFCLIDLCAKIPLETYHHAKSHTGYQEKHWITSANNWQLMQKSADNVKIFASVTSLICSGMLLGIYFMPAALTATTVMLGVGVGVSLLIDVLLLVKLFTQFTHNRNMQEKCVFNQNKLLQQYASAAPLKQDRHEAHTNIDDAQHPSARSLPDEESNRQDECPL